MEHLLPTFSIPTLLTPFLIILLITLIKTTKKPSKLPPGPWKLPLIGNLHQLLHPLPHHRLRDLSNRYGPFMHLQIGQLSTIVVSSPEFAKQVLKTHDLSFASRPYNFVVNVICYDRTDVAFCPYGEYWRQMRKICSLELFSVKRVESFRSIREEEVFDLVRWIGERENCPINLTERIFRWTNDVISRTMMGVKDERYQKLTKIIKRVLELAGGFSVVDMFPCVEGVLQRVTGVKSRLMKLHEEKDKILEDIIDQHVKRRKMRDVEDEVEDLVDVLLNVQEDGDAQVKLTHDNIKAVLIDMFMAGIDTSSITVDWAMAELIKNPSIMKKAQDEVREVFNRIGKINENDINEMKFLKAMIKETLRLHPPSPLLLRECGENCMIKGFEIPVKTRVIINAWALGRDPNYWNEPEKFNPERFIDSTIEYKENDFEYLPFGSGRRSCAGPSFGLANVELPLAILLYHFNWKLPNGMKHKDLDMTENFGITIGRKEDLYLIPIPYHPL